MQREHCVGTIWDIRSFLHRKFENALLDIKTKHGHIYSHFDREQNQSSGNYTSGQHAAETSIKASTVNANMTFLNLNSNNE